MISHVFWIIYAAFISNEDSPIGTRRMTHSIVVEAFSFLTFLSVCLFFFGRVLWDPTRLLTFPALTGAVALVYIAPQAFGVLRNPIYLPPEVFQHGFSKTMVMCALCVIMGFLGWNTRKREAQIKVEPTQMSPHRLMIAGTILTLSGLLAFAIITRQTGGVVGYYSVGGSYALDWLGSEVIAVFFMEIFLKL